MPHTPQIREVPGSREAVVLIHGILGTPAHFAPLLPAIDSRFSLYNLLLDGHGGAVKDFSATSMDKWHAQLQQFWDSILPRYDRVYLVAHSMGTLFAIRAAVEYPEKIAGLFLLSVPLRPFVRPRTMVAGLRLALGIHKETQQTEQEMLADSGVRLTPKLWQYLGWLPRFFELFREIRQVETLLPRLQVPTWAYQSRVDELVAFSSAKPLTGHPAIRLTVLEHSGHFAYRDTDATLLRKELANFLQ